MLPMKQLMRITKMITKQKSLLARPRVDSLVLVPKASTKARDSILAHEKWIFPQAGS